MKNKQENEEENLEEKSTEVEAVETDIEELTEGIEVPNVDVSQRVKSDLESENPVESQTQSAPKPFELPKPSSNSKKRYTGPKIVDDNGETFDPEIHKTEEDGTPKWSKTAKSKGKNIFLKRYESTASKWSNKAKSKFKNIFSKSHGSAESNATESAPLETEPLKVPQPSPDFSIYEVEAKKWVTIEEAGLMSVLGEGWAFNEIEKATLTAAYVRMFEKIGLVQAPWYVDVMLLHIIMFMQRRELEKTKSLIHKIGVKLGFIDLKKEKQNYVKERAENPSGQPSP
jgi:hypothetical protein